MTITLPPSDIGMTAMSVVAAALPLVAIFAVFQAFMLKLPRGDVIRIMAGASIAIIGLFLFLLGVGIGFLPFGRAIGEALGAVTDTRLLVAIGLALGYFTTWGEPAVRILADEVEEASNGSIRRSIVLHAVCVGVAVWVALGILRIRYEIPLLHLLLPGYAFALAVMWFSEKRFVSIAVDAGGVATGPLANTFLLALALGASSSMGSQDPIVQGLGLVALIAVAPVISVMILGFLVRWMERRKE